MKIRMFKANGKVYYMGADTIGAMPVGDAIDLYDALRKEKLDSFTMNGKEYSIDVLGEKIDGKFAELGKETAATMQ